MIGCGRVEKLRVGTMTSPPARVSYSAILRGDNGRAISRRHYAIVREQCRKRFCPAYARGADNARAMSGSWSLCRREAQNATRAVVGGEPERAVRPLAHIADTFAQLLQQALLLDHFVAVNFEPHQHLADQRAEEQAAAPRR